MPDQPDKLIAPFELAAQEAHRAEADYARQFEIELARRKRAREFAFRRLGLVRVLIKSACGDSDEAAVAAQVECLRAELGWHELSPPKEKIVEEFKKLAAVIHASAAAAGDAGSKKRRPTIAAAFVKFEAWYEQETGAPFLALFDHEIPEMPLVDF
ncbi:MAG: hypothetical protein ACT4SY_06695 [Hyphomicrobiales bacterium]